MSGKKWVACIFVKACPEELFLVCRWENHADNHYVKRYPSESRSAGGGRAY